jgi:hypothetical protein
MAIETIARALKARRSGAGWIAKCPVHDDNNPSLSIRDADGKVLLHCHAGCAQRDVIEALTARGLWEPQSEQRDHPARWGTLVCAYDYTDQNGNLLYQVVRFRDPKGFRPSITFH